MKRLGFGVVGTGFIANVIAGSIGKSKNGRVVAVASRSIDKAREFATRHGDAVIAVEGWRQLVSRKDVEAIYVASPTVTKEEIVLAAIADGKHVLVDKPFLDAASVARIAQAAERRGVLFMDGTHFVHHPRTAAIVRATPALVGDTISLHTAFFFPFSDRQNIRFDPDLEPTGVIGDLAWYAMRAIVEYLCPAGPLDAVRVVAERDRATGAICRASGLLGFADKKTATFDVGFTVGTIVMDLRLLGAKGGIWVDDFVLDWTNSFVFQRPAIVPGFTRRSGMATRAEAEFVETPSSTSQDILMVESFAALAASGDRTGAHAEASMATQRLVDAVWQACAPG